MATRQTIKPGHNITQHNTGKYNTDNISQLNTTKHTQNKPICNTNQKICENTHLTAQNNTEQLADIY